MATLPALSGRARMVAGGGLGGGMDGLLDCWDHVGTGGLLD